MSRRTAVGNRVKAMARRRWVGLSGFYIVGLITVIGYTNWHQIRYSHDHLVAVYAGTNFCVLTVALIAIWLSIRSNSFIGRIVGNSNEQIIESNSRLLDGQERLMEIATVQSKAADELLALIVETGNRALIYRALDTRYAGTGEGRHGKGSSTDETTGKPSLGHLPR